MKKLYFLFFLTIGFLANAQIINFPDANFKTKLLSATFGTTGSTQVASTASNPGLSPGIYHKIDTNDNGEIEVSEAELITYLNISSANITDLTGLSYFSNLKSLRCNSNQISDLNEVNTLSNLELFHFYYNDNSNLTQINLNNLVNLKNLHCPISYIDELILTNNINLEVLDCHSNYLTNLDLSSCTSIGYIRCEYNDLTNLDLPNSPNAYLLECHYNELTTLDVSGFPSLTKLWCNNNLLTNLDVSQCFLLDQLICSNNNLEVLNIKNGNANWVNLTLNYNPSLLYVCADDEDVSLVQSKIYSYPNCHVNTYCTFTPGGAFYEISGSTKFDFNNDGCDITDFDYKNLSFSISDGNNLSSMISNQSGNYYIPVGTGAFTITPTIETPTYFNISPTSFAVDFPTDASPFTQDFCVTANGIKSDVEIMVMPTTPARPGFDATYKLVYRNKGNQVENGSVSLTFDDARLDYVAANPVYNSSATNSFTWNYTNLQPFETREIKIVFNVNSPMEIPAVNNGDVLNYTATITTTNIDETPIDNTFTLDQTVVGSYDPNDKTCLQGATITPSEVGKYVHYVIRFENTGTFPAENIVVKDMIDLAKFDIATLVPLKSSHDFFTRISGNKVEFIFENINLDFNDATNDGYVVFKIKTKSTLVLGDTFTNNANIYFDYNFPITTNTYTTTVAALSTQDFDFGTYFTLYPNPAKNVLNIQSKQGLEVNSIEIYNQLGQVVMAVTNSVNAIDVSNLASGTYFVKVNTEKGSANAKFVKE